MGEQQNAVPQHYWNTLLSITTKAASESTAETAETQQPLPLSQESKEWLEGAMKELVAATDPSRILDNVMGGLLRFGSTTELSDEEREQVADLAGRLDDLLQFADLAPKFQRLGGFEIITRFLNYRAYPELRIVACDMLITMCENNPPAQEMVLNHSLFSHIFDLILDSKEDERLRYKMLGSVSAIVRSHAQSLDKFLEIGGHEKLTAVVESNEETSQRVQHKALRVLTTISYTFRDDPQHAILLKEWIARGYAALARRREEDSPEMAYVREYLQQDVSSDDVSEGVREDLLAALIHEKDLPFDDQSHVDLVNGLVRRYMGAQKG